MLVPANLPTRGFRTTISFIPVLLHSLAFIFGVQLLLRLPSRPCLASPAIPSIPWCLPCLQDTEGSLPPATGLAAADDSAVGHQAAPQLRAAQLRQQRQAAVPLVASVASLGGPWGGPWRGPWWGGPWGGRLGRPLGLQRVTTGDGDVTDGVVMNWRWHQLFCFHLASVEFGALMGPLLVTQSCHF